MINILITICALIMLTIGTLSMVTPIPGGTLLIAVSLSLLICSNKKAQSCMRYVRTKNDRFNKAIFWMENKVGVKVDFIGQALKQTRPIDESQKTVA